MTYRPKLDRFHNPLVAILPALDAMHYMSRSDAEDLVRLSMRQDRQLAILKSPPPPVRRAELEAEAVAVREAAESWLCWTCPEEMEEWLNARALDRALSSVQAMERALISSALRVGILRDELSRQAIMGTILGTIGSTQADKVEENHSARAKGARLTNGAQSAARDAWWRPWQEMRQDLMDKGMSKAEAIRRTKQQITIAMAEGRITLPPGHRNADGISDPTYWRRLSRLE